jgi:2-polyprenyl-3-methyl-5-hydroxy-6-metoxy-1,4-benzoquinol methylase
MRQFTNYIFNKIKELNAIQGKRLERNKVFFDDSYYQLANDFFNKYNEFLTAEGKSLDYAIDCYFQFVADINIETVEFFRTGKYSSTSFEEVNNRVYNNPEIMEYYMHALILTQFLWKHHYKLFSYFINVLPKYIDKIENYLEIGAGHGLYLSKALEILNSKTKFTAIDISKTSIEITKKIVNNQKVTFNVRNIFDYHPNEKFDFITMGEVLEHVEEPLKLLSKLKDLLTDNGTVFITTPTNAPAMDHIYLFNNTKEIQDLIELSGFRIEEKQLFISEDVTLERAEKNKICILFGAFLKKC